MIAIPSRDPVPTSLWEYHAVYMSRPSSSCLPEIVRNTRLRTEIVHNRCRIPRRGLFRHRFEDILQLSEVLALAWCSALDEFLPRFRICEAGVDYSVEDVVFGLDGYDRAIGTILEVFRLVLLGWHIQYTQTSKVGMETHLLLRWSCD